MNRLNYLAEILITVVSILETIQKSGKNAIIETNRGKIMNISPNNFKFVLSKQYPDEEPKRILSQLRKLNFIIGDKSGKSNTNVIYEKNKSKRMISIEKDFYNELKEAFYSKMSGDR